MKSWEQMRKEIDELAPHPSEVPYFHDCEGGFMCIEGTMNSKQLRIVANWLDEQDKPTMRCELNHCISNDRPGVVFVNDNSAGDASFRIGICQPCADELGVQDGDDIPDANTVREILKAAKNPDG